MAYGGYFFEFYLVVSHIFRIFTKQQKLRKMKSIESFKVKDGIVTINGVIYGPNPNNDVVIMGKLGRIHSINIPSKGQLFPIGGSFIDNTPHIKDSPIHSIKTKKVKKSSNK